jgi:hydrogenase expression/formation protein HypE
MSGEERSGGRLPEPSLACPVGRPDHAQILLGHGGGGLLTHRLIEQVFRPAFANSLLDARHDGAVLAVGGERLAFTTDSYVVCPLFFPGGDIGTLAVNGTINDLAMCGARPLFLSAAFILEEGLPIEMLRRVVASMRQVAQSGGVQIVTGDTKVVDRGKGDGLYINTAGVGLIEHSQTIAPTAIRPGDAVRLSGDIGRHGMAIMAVREGLAFETTIVSDCAAVTEPVQALLAAEIEVHCLRDLTRGGLATALAEIAEAARLHVHLEETAIPILEEVRGACEILGLDPLYVANEGRFVCFVPSAQREHALAILRKHPVATDAQRIGEVRDDAAGLVTMRNTLGTSRVLDMLSGEQLPRIC